MPVPVPNPGPGTLPTPTVNYEHGEPEDVEATPSKTTSEVGFTTTVKHGQDTKPVENIEIGPFHDSHKPVESSEIPTILNAVYKEVTHRVHDLADSSDELGLMR